MSYWTIALRPNEQLVEFRFVCKLNAKTAETRAKELLGQLRSALLTDSAFADNSYNLYAMRKSIA